MIKTANQTNIESYQSLVDRLVDISNLEAKLAILKANCHLIDKNLIAVAKNNIDRLLIQEEISASEWLENFIKELDDNLTIWEKLNRHTVTLYQNNDYQLALETAYKALAVAKKIWLGDRLEIAKNLSNIALILKAQKKLKEAEPYYRDTLAMRYRLYQGKPRFDLARCFSNLGELLKVQGRTNEAEPYYRDALKMQQQLSC